MNLIKECESDLRKIFKVKNSRERNKLIESVKNCVINAISEISLNCLKGNIPLSECNYNKLKRYKKVLRTLAKHTFPIYKKRILIKQKGGFLNILIPAALSLLISAVQNRIRNKND